MAVGVGCAAAVGVTVVVAGGVVVMKFRPIASSSDGNAYLLSCDGNPSLLIEAGVPWAQIQKALSFEASKLAGVAVSHGHGDHAKSAIDAAKAGLDVWVSPGTFGELHVPDDLRRRFRNVVGAPVMAGPWKLGAFAVEHDSVEPVGFVVGSPDGDKLVYLTDCSGCEIQFMDITHFAVECNHDRAGIAVADMDPSLRKRVAENHMSIESCLDFLRLQDVSKVREIWLLHLSDRNADADRYLDQVRKLTGRPTFVADRHETPAPKPATDVRRASGRIESVTLRRSHSGATVIQVGIDGVVEPLFATDARMHGFLVAAEGCMCSLRVEPGKTKNGLPMGTIVEILEIDGQRFANGNPREDEDGTAPSVTGIPANDLPWDD